jgi:hypothetical protein
MVMGELMGIAFACPNGHSLQAQDDKAGEILVCPRCGAKAMIPFPDLETDGSDVELTPLSDLVETLPEYSEAAATAIPNATFAASPSHSGEAKTASSRRIVWIAGLAGGAALALVLIVIVGLAILGSNTTATPGVASGPAAPGAGTPADASPADGSPAAPPTRPVVKRRLGDVEQVRDKLKTIALAFHNLHDTYKTFGAARSDSYWQTTGGNSNPPNPRLSWRVHLLPFLEQQPLYERFHLDEPWNSPHNLALLSEMPDIYRVDDSREPTTRIQVLAGPEMLFGQLSPPKLASVHDGTSNTILAVVADADRAVPWTQPDDLTFDPAAPLAVLGGMTDPWIPCAVVDGSTLMLPNTVDADTFLALATPRGSETVNLHYYQNLYYKKTPPGAAAPPVRSPQRTPPAPSPAQVSDETPVVHSKLRAVAAALTAYQWQFGLLPPEPASSESPGGQGLSWRVHILPLLGEFALYERFRMDEPWDSPHNRELLDSMPDIYRFDSADTRRTRIRGFTEPGLIFGPAPKVPTDHINALMAVAVGKEEGVVWTQPSDYPPEPETATRIRQSLAGGELAAISASSASSRLVSLPADLPEATLEALISPAARAKLPGGRLTRYAVELSTLGPMPALLPDPLSLCRERVGKLERVAKAALEFEQQRGFLPPGEDAVVDAEGKPNLSWRVYLLPYLGEKWLFDLFKLDQPWDSPHNQALLRYMPAVYRDPEDASDATSTRCLALAGPQGLPAGKHSLRRGDFQDGLSNTFLYVIAGADKAVPWSKPEDMHFEGEASLSLLGQPYGPGFTFVSASGHVHNIKRTIPGEWFAAMLTPASGEALPHEATYFGFRGTTSPPLAEADATSPPPPATAPAENRQATLNPGTGGVPEDSIAAVPQPSPPPAAPNAEPAAAPPNPPSRKAGGFELRVWKDATGRFSIEAVFSSLIGGDVKLRLTDGQVITVPLEKLSEADREYIDELRK